ncbi:uncharacterized protein K452DRAFT_248016 [Aplosporella prunicola CBS 121167]|uniref:Anaphase-promoting complex subunit 4 n=1 Tax=Aplosporella prunicola CBS 121167 TaxID=1176127 RepID=A0A6A6BJE7_9PEZI|nr:uncharacterized protein K452DRAFT_248016 [Aplosporella prunicola CBS 121167]KAF2143445.1 hypothetical protein K452DRAFT_248016 [Aplosporella prunicola CBS 121167]
MLMLQAEKALQQPVRPHLISYCPTMDLVAVVTREEQLDVYRLNGQRAFGLKQKSVGSSIDAIRWKFNGQYIAVAWDDGSVDIVSSETGKAVKQVRRRVLGADSAPNPRVSCLGWGVNFIDAAAVKARTRSKDGKSDDAASEQNPLFGTTDQWDDRQDEVTLDDFLERQPDLHKLGITPELPDQLALIDVQDVLPKLPAIPPPPVVGITMMNKASTSDAFSSQQSIDAIFHSQHLRDHNAVDVLLLGCDNGTINPTIYDSLEIGGMRVPSDWSLPDHNPLLHASHPYSCSHLTLMEIKNDKEQTPRIALVPLILRFIPTTGIYLHLIASKTAQLQNLLQYVQSCLRCIIAYFNHARDLPSKFIRNVNETLEEKGEGNLVQNLYHLAVTGHCPPTIKEWLTDELTESGHKRWDHAASQGYAKVVDLTHENLLPALDRLSIVVSMLRGLATYHKSSSIINVPSDQLTAILDTIRCLRLLGHNVMIYGNEERRQYEVFSKWLRHEIDVQSSDSSSNAPEDADRDPGIDHAQLLAYIPGAMTQSKLIPFLRRQTDIPNPPTGLPEYHEVKQSMAQHRRNEPIEEGSLCTWSVAGKLQDQCRNLFAQITKWQAQNSTIDCGLMLEDGQVSAKDMRMVYEDQEDGNITTYVALVLSDSKSEARLHRIEHGNVFSLDSLEPGQVQAATINFGDGEVQDVQFIDDIALMILYHSSQLLFLPYAFTPTTPDRPDIWPSTPNNAPSTAQALPTGTPPAPSTRTAWDLSTPEARRPFVRHVFPAGERFTPLRIDVNGRKDRRVVCVVGDDLKHYKIYDLDYESGKEGEGEGEGDTTVDTIMSG